MYRTKQSIVFAALREEIVSGKLPPGTHLKLGSIADRMGTSEIPVREALKRLQAEGFVETIPHAGARVSTPPRTDLLHMATIRYVLEPLAATLAAQHASKEQAEQLGSLVTDMERAVSHCDYERYAILNREFHSVIHEASGNPRLVDILSALWDHTERYRAVFKLVQGHTERSVYEHEQLFLAIRDGDAERAERWMQIHRLNAVAGTSRIINGEHYQTGGEALKGGRRRAD